MKTIITIILVTLVSNLYAQMPANSNNPYDAAGELHNEIFNYAKDKLNSKSTGSDITRLIFDYYRETGRKDLPSSVIMDPECLAFIIDFNEAKDKQAFLLSQGNMSPEAITYYVLLLEALLNVDFDDLYNRLTLVEASIQSDKILEQREKAILLLVAAVGRYSAYNWIENTSFSSTEKKNGWLADCTGALAGGLFGGAAVGTVTFGAGTLPGWVIGAVGHGAASSLEALIENISEE